MPQDDAVSAATDSSRTVAAGLLAWVWPGLGHLYLKRRAAKNLRAYFQGGRKLPWYMLGLSNASGMFDISGTMWLVTLCFVYGLKSIWIPWLWPVFNQVFLAADDQLAVLLYDIGHQQTGQSEAP